MTGTAEVIADLAEENVGAIAGAFVHEGQGGVIRLGGVYPDTGEYRSVMPSVLWALAVQGERVAEEFRLGLERATDHEARGRIEGEGARRLASPREVGAGHAPRFADADRSVWIGSPWPASRV